MSFLKNDRTEKRGMEEKGKRGRGEEGRDRREKGESGNPKLLKR